MRQIKKNIIVCVICGFFAGGFLLIVFLLPKIADTKAAINPAEFEATVLKVAEIEDDYIITTKEYNCGLFVDVDSMLNQESLLELETGDKIFFRLVELEENPLENPEIEQIVVVSLRSKRQDIITLESYYDGVEKDFNKIKNICTIGAIILSCIIIFNIVIIKKSRG